MNLVKLKHEHPIVAYVTPNIVIGKVKNEFGELEQLCFVSARSVGRLAIFHRIEGHTYDVKRLTKIPYGRAVWTACCVPKRWLIVVKPEHEVRNVFLQFPKLVDDLSADLR